MTRAEELAREGSWLNHFGRFYQGDWCQQERWHIRWYRNDGAIWYDAPPLVNRERDQLLRYGPPVRLREASSPWEQLDGVVLYDQPRKVRR